MGRLNNDEQFKFLISCIRYSNNGKVDFMEVAKECKIVTKGAAAKRYERMMKAHGIYQGPVSRDLTIATPKRKSEPTEQSRKRKLDDFSTSDHQATDDDESSRKVKAEDFGTTLALPTIKEEPFLLTEHDASSNYPWLCPPAALTRARNDSMRTANSTNEENLFGEFIADFEPVNRHPQFSNEQVGMDPPQFCRESAEMGEMASSIDQLGVGNGSDCFVIE